LFLALRMTIQPLGCQIIKVVHLNSCLDMIFQNRAPETEVSFKHSK
jgi:hypothetical protein